MARQIREGYVWGVRASSEYSNNYENIISTAPPPPIPWYMDAH